MNLPFIFHSQTIDGLAFNQEQVTVRLKTETLDFDSVYVRLEPDNEECLVDMTQVGTAGELLLWKHRSAQIEIEMSHIMCLSFSKMDNNTGSMHEAYKSVFHPKSSTLS